MILDLLLVLAAVSLAAYLSWRLTGRVPRWLGWLGAGIGGALLLLRTRRPPTAPTTPTPPPPPPEPHVTRTAGQIAAEKAARDRAALEEAGDDPDRLARELGRLR